MTTEQKTFDANRGLRLDGDWEGHSQTCERCRQFDATKPATAAVMCLEGAVLYKRDNAVVKRTHVERDEHHATKAQVKAAMRYKGE